MVWPFNRMSGPLLLLLVLLATDAVCGDPSLGDQTTATTAQTATPTQERRQLPASWPAGHERLTALNESPGPVSAPVVEPPPPPVSQQPASVTSLSTPLQTAREISFDPSQHLALGSENPISGAVALKMGWFRAEGVGKGTRKSRSVPPAVPDPPEASEIPSVPAENSKASHAKGRLEEFRVLHTG
ncbi:hypothetical protein CXG81DRAFT_16618 [Caulochytrium protostelioides]|uniref:G-patch domain-containing protein n=1 Tax=Caulochytrium protostelioides TaxID=1555241 RepID=A0A4P9XEE7_9FUNG|nr:hypothetical protein CXG81DRAFT_16618 [Caulochytrium protostelioides]|eukprot:RKP03913.1 hypothetical protein CXG81DRAFT_16618 [Caulochytrium protostelioides]